jgi:hypothetical protein
MLRHRRVSEEDLTVEKTDSASDVDEEPQEEVPDEKKKDESKLQIMLTRTAMGSVMAVFLLFILHMGPVYVCLTVVLIQVST